MTTTDEADLASLGYRQSLERSVGRFGSFAAGVSYISILTGTFQLFYFGFGSGGPAYWWSWPMVFAGQLMVALCFAELAARYPYAGSVYNWSKRLGSATVSWLAGWTMLVASIVSLAAVVLAYQLVLPQLWSGFQVVGDGTGTYDFAVNGVLWAALPLGLLAAPDLWALWSALGGAGQGGGFVAVFTVVVLRANSLRENRQLSAIVQTGGYVVASVGPIVIGALHDATGSWTPPLLTATGSLLVLTVLGALASRGVRA